MWEIGLPIAGKLLGGLFDDKSAEKQQAQNLAYQKEFAQSGIQWKVKDAQAAGVHPLYALGAQTHSYTPTQTQSTTGREVGEAIGNIPGQMGAKKTSALQNELLEAQINQVNSNTARNMNDIEQSKLNSAMALKKQSNINNQDDGIIVAGEKIPKNKGWSDAEDIETRYADVVSWLYGLGVLGADAKEWLKRQMKHDPKKALRYIKQKQREAQQMTGGGGGGQSW